MGILYAAITVLTWGTWLVPSQNVKFSGQQVRVFYVAIANLIISVLVAGTQDWNRMTVSGFASPFVGGMVWALGGWAAFAATDKIGLVRAFGIWAPLNILMGILFGALLFHEFVALQVRTTLILFLSLLLIVIGVLMIIFSKGSGPGKTGARVGFFGTCLAVAAGVLWAAYFLPIKMSKISMWLGAFPLACGMFVGCLAIVLVSRSPVSLSYRGDYLRAGCSGALWSIGNYGMLLLVEALGAGKGFTISQLAVVVNAICGIYILKDPSPGTHAARLALVGCIIATTGAIILGRLK